MFTRLCGGNRVRGVLAVRCADKNCINVGTLYQALYVGGGFDAIILRELGGAAATRYRYQSGSVEVLGNRFGVGAAHEAGANHAYSDFVHINPLSLPK
jgi:hypothetical protein